jgi:hypothetical protein
MESSNPLRPQVLNYAEPQLLNAAPPQALGASSASSERLVDWFPVRLVGDVLELLFHLLPSLLDGF